MAIKRTRMEYLRKVGAVVGLVCVVRVVLYYSVAGEGPGRLIRAAAIKILFEGRVRDRLSRRWNARGTGDRGSS